MRQNSNFNNILAFLACLSLADAWFVVHYKQIKDKVLTGNHEIYNTGKKELNNTDMGM